jgi:hypothetical protein
MKKVALIQSDFFFTNELKKKYLGNIPLLTSTDVAQIYRFIKKNAEKKLIFKYILHIDSGVLDKFIDYIYEKKNSKCKCISENAKKLLSKCILIATYSTADSVREKNIQKNTNIYFSLTPLSSILEKLADYDEPNRGMLVVSDTDTPYFNQIYSLNTPTKYRISELNIDIMNEFSKTGLVLIFAGEYRKDYQTIVDLIINSNFKQIFTLIEIPKMFLNELEPIVNKVPPIPMRIRYSGVGICGDINKYKDLNNIELYDNNVAVLINTYKFWKNYINNNLISIKNPNYNYQIYSYK